MGGSPILTIWGGCGDGFSTTWDVFLDLGFEYCLKCSEIDIASGVVFFSTLSGEIEAYTTTMRLQ